MTNDPDPKRRDALEARLNAIKKAQTPKSREESHVAGAQMGWRMVTELVVGLLMGAAIGYGLDHLFGTLPIFLVIFTLLGFAAGVRAMMRTATEVQAENTAQGAPVAPSGNDKMYDDD